MQKQPTLTAFQQAVYAIVSQYPELTDKQRVFECVLTLDSPHDYHDGHIDGACDWIAYNLYQ
ncbi:hypothetical protein R2E40_10020 [Aeromonas sp. CD]|uniref:hypothetical protein n=1 Tax=Aeromonas TaxID=642 RepID=UPI00296616ED|nr:MULTISPECIES: hypothetical protein [Aeromonas]WOX54424.1 hypothetical protein R2E40_10020 [Aeromonas sp. CD]